MSLLSDLLSRNSGGVGARISISKWKRSHQKGSACSVLLEWTIAEMMLDSVR